MSTAVRFEPQLPRRPLADVLVSTADGAEAVLAPLPLAGGSRRLLLAAAALAQARLTGEASVCLYEQHAGRWREREVELADEVRVDGWVDGLARAPARALSARTAAELALAWNARPRRPRQALALLCVVDGVLAIEVDAERIDRLAAEALRDAFLHAWQRLQEDRQGRLGGLSILSPQQRANLLCRWQSLRHDPLLDRHPLARLQDVVERHGASAAIIDFERTIDYATLWQRSADAARALIGRGIAAGARVIVYGPRRCERIIATLAAWRAGASVLALDETDLPGRLAAIVEASGATLLLATGAGRPASLAIATVALAELQASADSAPDWPEPAECLLLVDPDADHDGSRMPRWRAVAVGARALLRTARGVDSDWRAQRVLHAAPAASDRAVFECWAPLLGGGICVMHDEARSSEDGIARTLQRQPVDIALLHHRMFERIAACRPILLASLSRLLIGPLPATEHALQRVRQAAPRLRMFHVYGHAECTPLALCQPLDEAVRQSNSLGRPLAETTAHVLASDGGLLPVGAVGEICIGGCAVALGYHDRRGAALRRGSRFVADPLGTDGARLFRTGDHGRRLPDGRIEHVVPRRAGADRPRAADPARPSERLRQAATLACSAVRRAVVSAPSTGTDRRAIAALCERYRERTAGSLQRAGRSWLDAPRRIDYPLVIAQADAARIEDIDGNRYIDAVNAGGANLFGWRPAFLLDAWQRQLARGNAIGVEHPLAAEVGRALAELTRAQHVALCGSGDDALALAIRIARQATGRRPIARLVDGDALLLGRRHADRGGSADTELVRLAADDGALQRIDRQQPPFAAVVVDPLGHAVGDRHARRFIADLLARAAACGALSIFDERSSGLRCAPGGARQYLAIDADLSVFGSMLGGGLPFGALVASRAIAGFDQAAGPPVDCHPLAVAGAQALLQAIRTLGPPLQHELDARTAEFVRDGNRICRRLQQPLALSAVSSCWTLRLLDSTPRLRLIHPLLRLHGLHLREDQPGCMTWAHQPPDIRGMLDAFEAAVAELAAMGRPRGRARRAATEPIVLRPLPAPPRAVAAGAALPVSQ